MRFRARGRNTRREPGQLNGLERAYAERLTGLGVRHRFEAVKLRLADRTYYTPDFVVYDEQGLIEFHEVKAETGAGKPLIEDDAAVKIKVAAEQFPEFRFLLCSRASKKRGGEWTISEVG